MIDYLPVTGYLLRANQKAQQSVALYYALLWLTVGLLIGPMTARAAVLTSIRPLGFIAAAITQGVTPVEVLLPDGSSPHDYALRPSDLRRLQAAEIVLWVGPEMEAALAKSLQSVPLSKQLQLSRESMILPLLRDEWLTVDTQRADGHQGSGQRAAHKPGHALPAEPCGTCAYHHAHDWHIWLSPPIAKEIARLLQSKLAAVMPQHSERLAENLATFKQQLEQIEQNIIAMLAPVRQRPYFVFHDAYRYFALHFGLQQSGYFTLNPVLQPGAQRLHQIHQQLKQQAVVCLFTEPQFKPAVIETVARGTAVKIGVLDPLGSGIAMTERSYGHFLTQLATQFVDCLKE